MDNLIPPNLLADGAIPNSSAKKTRRTSTKRKIQAAIIVIVVMTWALGIYYLVDHRPKPSLNANERFYDFGLVHPANVTHSMNISNTGNADLTILNIWTSCGCTSVKLTVGGQVSPEFSKKGDAAFDKGWHATIHPGESSELLIRYNPWVTSTYYSGTRVIFIESDDPDHKVFQVTIKVQEVP